MDFLEMAYASDRTKILVVCRECGKLVDIHTPYQGASLRCFIMAYVSHWGDIAVETISNILSHPFPVFPQWVWITFLNKTYQSLAEETCRWDVFPRSGERRVGEEGRYRGAPY